MGVNLAWIAVEGLGRDEMLERLGFEAAGDTSNEFGSEYCCAELPGGWAVLTAKNGRFVTDQSIASASAGGFALGGEMSETGMFSQVRAFRDGVATWSVRRDCEKDGDGVHVEGQPPPPFLDLLSKAQAEQAALGDRQVDYLFDVPLELAASVCAYRPDAHAPLEGVIAERVGRQGAAPVSADRTSLLAAMKAQLLPALLSRGWSVAANPPNLADPTHIVRTIDGQPQAIWFGYEDGRETWIEAHFIATIPSSPEAGVLEAGVKVHAYVAPPQAHQSLWQRLTSRKPPSPVDPVGAAVERALRDIDVIETFLTTFEPSPSIRVEHRYRPLPSDEADEGASKT